MECTQRARADLMFYCNISVPLPVFMWSQWCLSKATRQEVRSWSGSPRVPVSRGNAPCSKWFLKQLIEGGTRIPIESVLRLFYEKLIIITELFIIYVLHYYRNGGVPAVRSECGLLYAYKSTLPACLLEPPIINLDLLKASPRNASGTAVFHCFLSQLT